MYACADTGVCSGQMPAGQGQSGESFLDRTCRWRLCGWLSDRGSLLTLPQEVSGEKALEHLPEGGPPELSAGLDCGLSAEAGRGEGGCREAPGAEVLLGSCDGSGILGQSPLPDGAGRAGWGLGLGLAQGPL